MYPPEWEQLVATVEGSNDLLDDKDDGDFNDVVVKHTARSTTAVDANSSCRNDDALIVHKVAWIFMILTTRRPRYILQQKMRKERRCRGVVVEKEFSLMTSRHVSTTTLLGLRTTADV
jgi:hypothetical protein